jgi:hypothetical protein
MKKLWFINLSLLLTVSIFAQSVNEVELTVVKNEIHSRFDNRKEKGFYNIMQVNLIMGSVQSNGTTNYNTSNSTYIPYVSQAPTYYYPYTRNDLNVVPSFTITNGYRFDKHWAAGAGVGFEIFDYNLFPLFAELRYTLWDNKISPFMVVKGGYSVAGFKSKHYDNLYLNWSPYNINDAELRNYGGLMFQPEIGVKVPLNENSDLLFTAGYRYQKTKSVVRKDYNNNQFDEWEHTEDINRLSFGVAIMFR